MSRQRITLRGKMLSLVVASALVITLWAASATSGSVSGQAQTVVVPNVVGLRMDRATRLLHSRNLRVNEECPEALFGCIIKSNWWICRQYPRAGKRVRRYAVIITYGVRERGRTDC